MANALVLKMNAKKHDLKTFRRPTQSSVVEPEVLPFLYVAGVINGINEVIILFILVQDADKRQVITYQQTVPELQDTACGLSGGNHIATVRLLFTPLNGRYCSGHAV